MKKKKKEWTFNKPRLWKKLQEKGTKGDKGT